MTPTYNTSGDVRLADDRLRAGDGDRDRVADQLRAAHAEGRLDSDELAERIERCLRARTFGELERLTADLRQPGRGGGLSRVSRRPRARIVLAVIVLLWVLSAAAHRHAHVIGLLVVLAFAFMASRLVRAVGA